MLTGIAWASKTSKPSPSDTPPSTRPQLLILSKQSYQLGTEPSNIRSLRCPHLNANSGVWRRVVWHVQRRGPGLEAFPREMKRRAQLLGRTKQLALWKKAGPESTVQPACGHRSGDWSVCCEQGHRAPQRPLQPLLQLCFIEVGVPWEYL